MYKLTYTQNLPIPLDQAWEFFSNPSNLAIITPPSLQFTMTCDADEMYPGQIITHTIRPLLIPIRWVTEITHVDKPHYFIDEQRFGPYRYWHHEHRFIPIPGGTAMTDTIYYKLPFGTSWFLHPKVSRDVKGIFAYRQQKLISLFGS